MLKPNRQQRRQQDQIIHKHRNHPKVYRQFDGESGVYGETICLKCQCHVAYLDKAEWREVEIYNRNRELDQRLQRVSDGIANYNTGKINDK